jgi:hypothetical protein
MTQGLAAQTVTAPPGEVVTRYPVIAVPPSETGAVKDTTAIPLPALTETIDGIPGTAAGITALDEADSTLSPTVLVACTVNVYDEPFVNPATTHGDAAHVAVAPPGPAVTV